MMKRYGLRLTLLGMIFLLQTGCGTVDRKEKVESQMSNVEITESRTEETAESSEQKEAVAETSDEKQETVQIENTPEPTKEPEIIEESLVVDRIPVKHSSPIYVGSGTIQEISYPTKDYFGDGSELTKPAYVYLPKDYDESKQYNVLYLMHGIGGNEKEWGMFNSSSKVKAMMDHLIEDGEIEPFIVVAVNGRSGADFANTNADWNTFYLFGQELRNDLIPYIDANFATYAEYDENGYDLTVARDHRAMAGLSMGGMQTTNIGMCECLDIISYFGAFSAAPTTYNATKIAECLEDFEKYDVNLYYAICGTEDGIAYQSARAAVSGLTDKTDKLTDGENFLWQTKKGGHDFNIWYLGYYNFARLVFQ